MTISGVCYSDIHYGGVKLYQWGSPPVVSIFLTRLYFPVLSESTLYKYFRFRVSIKTSVSRSMLRC